MKNNQNKRIITIGCMILSAFSSAAYAQQGNTINLDQGAGYDATITQSGTSNSITLKQVDSTYNAGSKLGRPTANINQSGSLNKMDVLQSGGVNGQVLPVSQEGTNNNIKLRLNTVNSAGEIGVSQSGSNNTIDSSISAYNRGVGYITQAGNNNNITSSGSINAVQTATASNSSIVSDYTLNALQEGNNQRIISTFSGNNGSFGGSNVKQFLSATGAFAEVRTGGLGSARVEQYGEGAHAYAETGAYGETTITQKGKNNSANVRNPGSSIVKVSQELGSDGSEANVKASGGRSETNILQDGVSNLANVSIGGAWTKTNVQQFNGTNTLNVVGNATAGVIDVTQRGGSSATIIQR